MERGVGEGGVDPGHGEDGEEGVDDRHHKQVPVVGGALLQSVEKSKQTCSIFNVSGI